jgi:predicted RNase H-like nuclease
MTYCGIDLAWKTKKEKTAIAILNRNGVFQQSFICTTDQEIEDIISSLGKETHVGIDASLIVKNLEGKRSCEIALAKDGIKAIPSNLTNFNRFYQGVRGAVLLKRLCRLGFQLIDNYSSGRSRTIIEVFPHASWKRLFPQFNRSFKKGNSADKREGLRQAFRLLKQIIPRYNLNYTIYGLYTLSQVRRIDFDVGRDLIHATDLFDAAMAAYTTFLFHSSQSRACQIYGSIAEDGFIIVPRPALLPN